MDETRMHVIEVDPLRIDVRRRLSFLACAVTAAGTAEGAALSEEASAAGLDTEVAPWKET